MRKLLIPLVCVGMLAVAVLHVARQKEPPQLTPPAQPSRSKIFFPAVLSARGVFGFGGGFNDWIYRANA